MNVGVQLVNYTLALLMWLVIGRVVLSLFTSSRENFIMSFFIKFTEPVYKVVKKIFPFAKESCIPSLSILFIVIIRVTLIIIFRQ
jgi:uncharacterized protein YggT (Ycf19 family)